MWGIKTHKIWEGLCHLSSLKREEKLLEKKIRKKPEDTAEQCRVKGLNHKETEKGKMLVSLIQFASKF